MSNKKKLRGQRGKRGRRGQQPAQPAPGINRESLGRWVPGKGWSRITQRRGR